MIDIDDLDFKEFPGGELHITSAWYTRFILGEANPHIRKDNLAVVLCRIRSSNDFMKLVLFTDAFKRAFGYSPNQLILPYIPYARQDRVPVKGEALSIKAFTNLLNSLEYSEVVVIDPHSDVSTALIENVTIIPQWTVWKSTLFDLYKEYGELDLISPDAGALKKIYNLVSIGTHVISDNVRVGTKHRDTLTGKITGTSVDGKAKNKVGIIIDDICDGGRTFIELAKFLHGQYERLILCVTHGIFSKGVHELSDCFDEIHSTNSWNIRLDNYVELKVLDIKEDILYRNKLLSL